MISNEGEREHGSTASEPQLEHEDAPAKAPIGAATPLSGPAPAPPAPAASAAPGAAAAEAEAVPAEPLVDRPAEEIEQEIIDVLRSCYDPEIPVNIYDLGLIYDIRLDDEKNVHVKMTLTSPMCPVAGTLPPEVQWKVGRVPGVRSAKVDVVWEPTWTQDMMGEAAKIKLGLDL